MSTLEFNGLLVSNMDYIRQFALNFTRNSEDSEDLLQETMAKALRYRNNFSEGTNFKGWLYTIMKNIFINDYKKKKNQQTYTDPTENQFFLHSAKSVQADSVTGSMAMKDIQSALSNLDHAFRIPMQMFLDGFHYDEIAEELGIPMGTVKSRIFHARKKLQTALGDYR